MKSHILILYLSRMKTDDTFMIKAIEVARKCFEIWEYPIWAVIVRDDKIIGIWESRQRRDEDPTAHAEMVAIRDACKNINSRSLKWCVIYTTQECCPMCAAAIVWAKMDGIVFGAYSEDTKWKWSDTLSWRQIWIPCREVLDKSYPKTELVEWFMRDECKELITISSE